MRFRIAEPRTEHSAPQFGMGERAMKIDLLRRLFLTYWRWRQRRETLRQLQALDDRMLKDIGLNRTELMSVVEECLPGSTVPYCLRRRAFIRPPAVIAPAHGQDNDRSGMQPAA